VGKTSEGALVVDLQDKKLGVAMIVKSDGASLYMTRDIATALYREKDMEAKKAIYVVGEDQRLYFQQLFEILKRMGHPIGAESAHVYFGMVSLPEGKMSTRKGRVILLKDVIERGLKEAKKILNEREKARKKKNPKNYTNLSGDMRDVVIKQITVGAMKWSDLSQDPKKPIIFDWHKALNFEGNSAPYVQYQAVRANKLVKDSGISLKDLEKTAISEPTTKVYQSEAEHDLVIALAEFPKVLSEAQAKYIPSRIANYAFDLSKKFSAFYENVSVRNANNESDMLARLKLAAATSQVITNSLALLGIEVPEAM
jgi:arginyl-tRNA synthetase